MLPKLTKHLKDKKFSKYDEAVFEFSVVQDKGIFEKRRINAGTFCEMCGFKNIKLYK